MNDFTFVVRIIVILFTIWALFKLTMLNKDIYNERENIKQN